MQHQRSRRGTSPLSRIAIALAALCVLTNRSLAATATSDPFVDAIVAFTPGAHAGFGSDRLTEIVFGPPLGAGELQGSTDTLSLGDGGSIVLGFDEPGICDLPGADFVIFENAFHAGSESGPLFYELGIVAISADGVHFTELPFNSQSLDGFAGKAPVYSNPANGIDPLDPSVAGGDAFDLAGSGLPSIRYIRITDPGDSIPDAGSRVVPGNSGGFDLDAIAALHTCDGQEPSATPTPTPSATSTPTAAVATTASPTATVSPTNTAATTTATATTTVASMATATATRTPTAVDTPQAGDVNGDGRVDQQDLAAVIAALFVATPLDSADTNEDGVVAAADVTEVIHYSSGIAPGSPRRSSR